MSMDEIIERLRRIEVKLDFLIRCLAEEEECDEPQFDLDGNPSGAPRNPSEPLS